MTETEKFEKNAEEFAKLPDFERMLFQDCLENSKGVDLHELEYASNIRDAAEMLRYITYDLYRKGILKDE